MVNQKYLNTSGYIDHIVYWPDLPRGYFSEVFEKQDSVHRLILVSEAEKLPFAEAAVIRSRTLVDANWLKKARQIKFVVSSTSGYDHIDFVATNENNVVISYTPDANAASAAELTWALLLNLVKKLELAQKNLRAGNWRKDLGWGLELQGKSLGIIGLGRVGKRVAKIAKAFEMEVYAYDPYITELDFQRAGVERSSLHEIFRLSDIVSLHVPKTKATERLISRSLLEDCADGLLLVNTSRGSAVQDDDLDQALREGWLAGAALDVFEREPITQDSKLLTLAKQFPLVLSPHVGAHTEAAYLRGGHEALSQIHDFFAFGRVLHKLPIDFNLLSENRA